MNIQLPYKVIAIWQCPDHLEIHSFQSLFPIKVVPKRM